MYSSLVIVHLFQIRYAPSIMSTREIDEFLDKESDTKGIPKSELIRQALTDMVRRNHH